MCFQVAMRLEAGGGQKDGDALVAAERMQIGVARGDRLGAHHLQFGFEFRFGDLGAVGLAHALGTCAVLEHLISPVQMAFHEAARER